MKDLTSYLPSTDKLMEFIITYGGKLLLALITLLIGLWLIGRLGKILKRIFEMRSFEQTLQTFLIQLISNTLKILLFISVVTMIGVQMTSFIAILGAAGLAFGLALSGTLQNFAGGVMLLILKPFKAGDFIEAQGFMGTVKEIQIFHTVLNTPDNKLIIIPNGPLSNGAATNFSAEPQRRVDWNFGISYSSNIEKVKDVVIELLNADDRVLKDPEHFIAVDSLGDSSVKLVVRAWVGTSDYWNVFYAMNEKVKNAFLANEISFPFPQRDIHLYQKSEAGSDK